MEACRGESQPAAADPRGSVHIATLKINKSSGGLVNHSLITIRRVLGGHQYAGADGRCTQLPVVDQYTDEHSSGALVY